jgi:hypothetical protein
MTREQCIALLQAAADHAAQKRYDLVKNRSRYPVKQRVYEAARLAVSRRWQVMGDTGQLPDGVMWPELSDYVERAVSRVVPY